MILDETLEIADSVDVSGSTGTALEGDQIDLGRAGQRPGTKQPLYLVIQVTAAFTSGTASTVQFCLASDAQAAITTNGTETRHWLSDAYADSALTLGKTIIAPLPSGDASPYERYLGLLVITGAAATTAGSINAFLTETPHDWEALPDGDN